MQDTHRAKTNVKQKRKHNRNTKLKLTSTSKTKKRSQPYALYLPYTPNCDVGKDTPFKLEVNNHLFSTSLISSIFFVGW